MQRSSAPSPASVPGSKGDQPAPMYGPRNRSPAVSQKSSISSIRSISAPGSPVTVPRRTSSTSFGRLKAQASDTSPSRRMSTLSVSSGFSSSSNDGIPTVKNRPAGPKKRPSTKVIGASARPESGKYSPSPSRKPSTHVHPMIRRDSGNGAHSSSQTHKQQEGLKHDLNNHAKLLSGLRSQQHTLKHDILREHGSTIKTQPAISSLTSLATIVDRDFNATRELISQLGENADETKVDGISSQLVNLVNDAHFHQEQIDGIKREAEGWKN